MPASVALYKPFVNTTKSKNKYWVLIKSDNKKGFKRIGFGSKDHQHFKDKLGYYKNLDHGDPVRRKSYLARSKGIKNKQGELTWKNKDSANYWSRTILWAG
tara:strand:- start:996 stop:1298 length:303 start_codon:yes stop_codon:yes gene_type:complete